MLWTRKRFARNSEMELIIRNLSPSDWEAVRAIYRQGIASGHATFETVSPDWDRWNRSHRTDVRLVACDAERVMGWAALSPVSARQVYDGVAEVSVYVADEGQNKGVGRLLLEHLIEAAERAGVWTLQAMVFPENEASLRLHQQCGFRLVGYRERLARLKGVWRDVMLMERRSARVGMP